MDNNKPNSQSRHDDIQSHERSSNREFGYIYIVKSPASNELTVCAHTAKLTRDQKVIFPSRYGLDYGVVVGSAMEMGQYEPGTLDCQGSCLHGGCVNTSSSVDEELLASSDELGIEVLGEEEKSFQDENTIVEIEIAKDMVKISGDVDWIERLVDVEDEAKYQDLVIKENEALLLCRKKVLQHKLDMKLVSAHYLFGEPKIIFFFTSANRVDFRELVKDLVSVFRVRIELRQIGVRDESRLIGGLAVCGRDYCCHCLADKLNPVSIKMAKEQNLSLNSTKISGPCGRLLCCLSYEYDFYIEEKKKLPTEGSKIKILHELMRISDINIVSRKLTVTSIDGRSISIPLNKLTYDEHHKRWDVEKGYLEEILST
jgi:cell fate regulator YaaT (PSP1 superfamily)